MRVPRLTEVQRPLGKLSSPFQGYNLIVLFRSGHHLSQNATAWETAETHHGVDESLVATDSHFEVSSDDSHFLWLRRAVLMNKARPGKIILQSSEESAFSALLLELPSTPAEDIAVQHNSSQIGYSPFLQAFGLRVTTSLGTSTRLGVSAGLQFCCLKRARTAGPTTTESHPQNTSRRLFT
jgi:hypothetical protein